MGAVLLSIMVGSVVVGLVALGFDRAFGRWNDRILMASIASFVVAGTLMSFTDVGRSGGSLRECGGGPTRHEC